MNLRKWFIKNYVKTKPEHELLLWRGQYFLMVFGLLLCINCISIMASWLRASELGTEIVVNYKVYFWTTLLAGGCLAMAIQDFWNYFIGRFVKV